MRKIILFAVIIPLFISIISADSNNSSSIPYTISNYTQITTQTSPCPVYINTKINGINQALDYSIPTGNFVIGPGISCDTISIAKWFVQYQYQNGTYSITGIRIYIILILIIVIFVLREIFK